MCISQSVRGRVALGGAELFPGLGVVGSHLPCAAPHHVLGAARGAHPPTACPPSGRAPSVPISMWCCHARCRCGLNLASMGWHMVGMGCGDGGLGPLTQAGGIGYAGPDPVSLCHPVQCPAGLSQLWGSSIPGAHRGLPQWKVGSGPHSAGAARGVQCWAWLHPLLPHCAPSPWLSKATAGLACFGGPS